MKKGFYGILALVILAVAGFASATIPGDCPSSMVGFWQLDGDADDSYINNFDGSGWPGTGVLKINGAALFTGTGKISIPDANALDLTNGFTIQFWVQQSNNVIPNSTLIKKGNYQIDYVNTSANNGYIRARVGGVELSSKVMPMANPWPIAFYPKFVTLVWNKAGQDLILYINGTEVNRTTLTGLTETTTNLEFGEGFKGLMDEVAFYNVALDSDEVRDYYVSSGAGRDYCYLAGAGGSSKTLTNFTIAGCDLPDGGSLTAGSCNLYYYCGNISLILYDTLRDNLGCSYEQTSLPVGDNRGCCPPGYYCNATPEAVASGDVTCTQYSWICSDFTDDGQPECEAHPGCFWVSTGVASEDYCTDDLSGLGCSVYKSETYCRNDDMELGVLGYGTDSCRDENIPIKCEGKSFVLDGCQCQWNTADGTCELIQRISSDFYNESTNYTFTCNKLFGMGDCLEGEQKVNWTARMVDISTGSPIPATATMMECIKNATGCRDGATTRFCGEEVVKLPGFSLFALLTSIVVIGLFYIFKKDL